MPLPETAEETFMETLTDRLMARVGLSEAQARSAVRVLSTFLSTEAPPPTRARLHAVLPDLAPATGSGEPEADGDGTSHFGGMARLMRVADRLMAEGLSMIEVQATVREVVAYARETAGDATVDEIVTAIPGLRHAL